MPVTGYDSLITQVNQMLNIDRAMTAAMNSVLAAQNKRIFEDGKAADGTTFGNYKSNGSQRRNKDRKGKKKILRDTDQMMMDLTTFVLGKGEYGIGFNNQLNKQKSEWQEGQIGKEIFISSEAEDDLAMKILQFELNKI